MSGMRNNLGMGVARAALLAGSVLASAAWGSSATGAAAANAPPAASPAAGAFTGYGPQTFEGLQWRLIGPFRGGRVTGVTGVSGDRDTYYFGAAAGGVWKTTDAGVTWKPLWDNFPQASPAVGAVAVAPSDPRIVYAGTGEMNIRGNVVSGNGLYKSSDAGKTWTFVGLPHSGAIGRILIDPKNPEIVFVAALGDIFADNDERGLFKSTDGGKTWRKVLYVDDKTGASDVRFDPTDPKVMWAGMWQAYRKPWIMESGGPGGGLYKSTDGGETWTRQSGHGLPNGLIGRVNIAPTSDPKRVYAMIEAKKGGLYRTDDGGESWTLVNDKNDYRQRAWYFNGVFADPKTPDTVYVLNTSLYRSTDAGKTFKAIRVPHGDTHELWIDPADPKRMINSNDGGAIVTVDGGESWSSEENQPTAQFYHVAADDRFPFHIYGAQQDNSTIDIATAGESGGVGIEDWRDAGGGESGFVVPDLKHPGVVYASGYGAELTRLDPATGEERQITPWPRNTMGWAPKDLAHRFQWTAAILLSNHPDHALYFASEVLWKSVDEGQSWTVISPDLTRNDKDHQQSSGGPLTKDNTSVETFGTIFALAESPIEMGLIWAGSDDGLVHITRDGGAHWADVTPPGLVADSTVESIESDPRDPATAYLAAERRRLNDDRPLAFVTHDYGRTWASISSDLPTGAALHAIRADPERAGLLYAATELGVFLSYDSGAHWSSLQLNLPRTPVHDLTVHGDSLAIATHGRAFWMLDDLAPIRQWSKDDATAKVHLFAPAPASHTVFPTRLGGLRAPGGANPPAGVEIVYSLATGVGTPPPPPGEKTPDVDKTKAKAPDPWSGRLKLEILDAQGTVVRTYPDPHVVKDTSEAAPSEDEDEGPRGGGEPKLPHLAGLNRFVWDLHEDGAVAIPHAPLWAGSVRGPKALPGHYQVRLTLDGASQTAPFDVTPDPRVSATPADLQAQFDLQKAIVAKLTEVDEAVLAIRDLRHRIGEVTAKDPSKAKAGAALDAKITAIEEVLIQPRAHASEDALNYPVRLNNMIAALNALVGSADARPTDQEAAMFKTLSAEADTQLAAWREIEAGEAKAFAAGVKS
ncbi:MAG: glycosyl hydrolase [Alphaproteobacteria bacterium]|nr:glycosyl hydrolase [Alphaproteobacteria bacterium]